MNQNLTGKTLHALKWSYLSTAVNAVFQIGFTAVMARLLEPAAFGLIAMAGVVLRFGSYFAQMGIGSALVQKKELGEEEVRAAFSASLVLGVVFTALIWVAAPLVIYLFNDNQLVLIVRVMAFTFLFGGLSATALGVLRRKMDFKILAITEIGSYVIGYGFVGVVLASNGFGVWSLVGASLGQSALLAIFSYFFERHPVWLIGGWKHYQKLYSFGSRISIIGFLEFLGSNLDTLAIGHLSGPIPLGIYNRAFMLVNLPAQYLTSSSSRVLVPSFSRVQSEVPRVRTAYLSTLLLVSSLLIPGCLGVAACSREVVLVVLGERWGAAIPILQVLAIGAMFGLLSHFGAIVCEATAHLNVKIVIQSIYLVALLIVFYFLNGQDIIAYATAVTGGSVFLFVAYSVVVKRILALENRELVNALAPATYSGTAIAASLVILSTLMRMTSVPTIVVFCVELFVGLSLMCSLFFTKPEILLRTEVCRKLEASGSNLKPTTALGWLYSICHRSIVTDSAPGGLS